MEAAGFSVALVTLPVSVIQGIREIKDIISRFNNRPSELNGLSIELDTVLDSAARINALAALGAKEKIFSEPEARRFNESVRHVEQIVERLRADICRAEKKNLHSRLVYALGIDGIRDRQRELSNAVAAVNVAINAFTASQQIGVSRRLISLQESVDGLPSLIQQSNPRGQDNSAEDRIQSFRHGFHIEDVHMILDFIPRPEYMDALRRTLLPASSPRRKISVLHGLGGIGKTQLALKFARDHQDEFSSVFFVDGSSRDSLAESFAVIHRRITGSTQPSNPLGAGQSVQVPMEQVTRDVRQWLSDESNSAWLLIVDNVDKDVDDEGGYDILPQLPSRDHGSVLITSRLASLAHLGHGIKVSKMSDGEANSLFEQLIGSRTQLTTTTDSTTELLTILDGLPLAIAQAGRLMKTLNVGTQSYLEMYGSERREVLDLLSGQPEMQDATKSSIRTTWNISLKLLKDKVSQHGPNSNYFAAHRLLHLFAYFHPTDISFETLRRGLVCNAVPDWFHRTFTSKARFLSVVWILIDLSLIDNTTGTEGSYSMHRVVHDWLCLYVAHDNDADLLRLAVSAIAFSTPLVFTSVSCWAEEQRQLSLHAVQVMTRLRSTEPSFDPLPFLVRFDRLAPADLAQVASLLHGQPPLTWQLMKFDHALGGISRLLHSGGKPRESYQLLMRATKNMETYPEAIKATFDYQVTKALLVYYRRTGEVSIGLSVMDSVMGLLRSQFEELGAISWAIKAWNFYALDVEAVNLELAIEAWRGALNASRSLFGSIFPHPGFMVFLNLAGRLERTRRWKEFAELFKSVEQDASKHLGSFAEAEWVLGVSQRLSIGNLGPFIARAAKMNPNNKGST